MFVRVNPLGSGHADEDLSAVLGAKPDALVLPKAEGATSVLALGVVRPACVALDGAMLDAPHLKQA